MRGWRPSGDKGLTLVDGPFLEMVKLAQDNPGIPHVMLIEEINRGNPAQIFGELLTLLEADKRNEASALALLCRAEPDEHIFVPDNLYVIGTMNIADRSLALVDLALRRRFAFIELAPCLNEAWQNWVARENGISQTVLFKIRQAMNALNSQIASDRQLGPQFQIGHSYVTPAPGTKIDDPREWFTQVVETEIGPLLDEYWFEDISRARAAREALYNALHHQNP